MKNLNQMIPGHLNPQDGTSHFELPELTPEEQRQAINTEKARRAAVLACSPADITISPDTAEKLLQKAREQKAANIKAKSYWDKVYKPRPIKTLNYDQLYNLFLARASVLAGHPFIIDDHNRDVIHQLCLYFTSQPETRNSQPETLNPQPETRNSQPETHQQINESTNQQSLNPTKGLLLAGGVGCGKTTIMRAFSSNPLSTYRVIPARIISFQYAEHGIHIIREFTRSESIPINQYGHTETGICFDDLGTEEERKHFGDSINAMAEILLSRYDTIPFNQTHITTNLNADAIEQIYGSRLRSRMREMFNLIHFPTSSPDRR
ncbi:MAG: hypothetical protein Q8S18_07630 [Bacteroidales bacterium]|nr:hypothetical protein [Bacteroidales bacterium]